MIRKSQELQCFTSDQIEMGSNIVGLWLADAIWSNSHIQSTVGNLPNLAAVADRLNQLPTDFYNVLIDFFGETLAQQYLNYMNKRIALEGNLLDAMIDNNQNLADTYTRELYANADDISTFFAQFPFWDKNVWQTLLNDHISMYIHAIESVLSGDYNRQVSIYETMINHSVMMGNYMAYGILTGE